MSKLTESWIGKQINKKAKNGLRTIEGNGIIQHILDHVTEWMLILFSMVLLV